MFPFSFLYFKNIGAFGTEKKCGYFKQNFIIYILCVCEYVQVSASACGDQSLNPLDLDGYMVLSRLICVWEIKLGSSESPDHILSTD